MRCPAAGGVFEYDLAVADKVLVQGDAVGWLGKQQAAERGCAMVVSDAAAYAQHAPDEGTKP
jgi:hypothetical protein